MFIIVGNLFASLPSGSVQNIAGQLWRIFLNLQNIDNMTPKQNITNIHDVLSFVIRHEDVHIVIMKVFNGDNWNIQQENFPVLYVIERFLGLR